MRSGPLAAGAALVLIFAGAIGCDAAKKPTATEPADDPAVVGERAEEYAIRGVVTAVDREEPSVTIDHEEIVGLMAAMTMKFDVENAQLLEGVEVGDQVEGELVEQDDRYVIIALRE